jgi:hypothetical protein
MDIFCGGIIEVNEDIRLYTSPLGEYETSAVELCIVDGKLSYNLVVTQEQNLAFADISTGETYMIIYDSVSKGLLLEKCEVEECEDSMLLIDTNGMLIYQVYVDNGQLMYSDKFTIIGGITSG